MKAGMKRKRKILIPSFILNHRVEGDLEKREKRVEWRLKKGKFLGAPFQNIFDDEDER